MSAPADAATDAPLRAGPSADDLLLALAVFAVDPAATGVRLQALPGEPRRRLLDALTVMLPEADPVRPVPLHVTDDRLLGGLDLAATLQAGRPVVARGLLEEADGGVLILTMAERLERQAVGRVAAAMDRGEVLLERDGITRRGRTRFGVLALDEGVNPEERPPAALLDRLALHLDARHLSMRAVGLEPFTREEIIAARDRLPGVRVRPDLETGLCAAALALGVTSLRASQQVLAVARTLAALAGADEVDEQTAATAARLALVPRATRLPLPPEEDQAEAEPPAEQTPPDPGDDRSSALPETDELTELLLEAARAALPEDLLARLQAGMELRDARAGVAGAMTQGTGRGRPAGVRAGMPRRGERLSVVETLRAAAPWQRLRRDEADRRVRVRREDFRVRRLAHRSSTTTIFVVDASGSAAAQRLAEAKGAVELLLADCYVRRDEVALIAFRGAGADLLLPPTRSLLRARRELAGLPGGGGTPLAQAIDAAHRLALDARRRGTTPVLVFLTDGRANIALDGERDRARAGEDARRMALGLAADALQAILIDTARRPDPDAADLARAMRALYQPLPVADAGAVSGLVRSVTAAEGRA